ncbi:hypothetical protein PHMEG_0005012 [Phytophthora megakarya]|uniref:ZSWIM1/3 RNaseH-like domain-containing protein n=1 Tax=Phytophthora megakarya TaxID=4795 RepID=A0A225WUG4_9STRA|nr:hypothetical protein PHMEG_0005012 [Phytophthora megakarya]
MVLVNSTHDTNTNRYKLFRFAMHDVFGRVEDCWLILKTDRKWSIRSTRSLVRTKEKPNLQLAMDVFKRDNPEWNNIKVVMTDKVLREKEVLHAAWPNARQLLCSWHVETWLKKQRSIKDLKVIMKGLVNAESQQQYDDLKDALLTTVDGNDDSLRYKSFMKHRDTSTDEWVMFKRVEFRI